MKKLLIIFLSAFAFACGDSENAAQTSGATDESVEIGSGEEITPQVEVESDSSKALEVDTISSSAQSDQPGQ